MSSVGGVLTSSIKSVMAIAKIASLKLLTRSFGNRFMILKILFFLTLHERCGLSNPVVAADPVGKKFNCQRYAVDHFRCELADLLKGINAYLVKTLLYDW